MCSGLRIGITMRRSDSCTYTESREGLSFSWRTFMQNFFSDALWVPLPSLGRDIIRMVDGFEINCIILSGGENIDCNIHRDITELALIKWCSEQSIPLLGVCRGMQIINHYYGGNISLNSAPDHIACRHIVNFVENGEGVSQKREVNSYHSNIINSEMLAPDLIPVAFDEVGHVEAIRASCDPFLGIMWHPEREEVPDKEDIKLIKDHFCDRSFFV